MRGLVKEHQIYIYIYREELVEKGKIESKLPCSQYHPPLGTQLQASGKNFQPRLYLYDSDPLWTCTILLEPMF